jgi:hypothetical protein
MPRRKKKAPEQTTDEALKRLFPAQLRRKLKELAGKPLKRKGDKRP